MKFEPVLVIQPNFYGPLVTILTVFHCILKRSIDPSAPWVKKHSNTAFPGRARSVKYPTPGPTKTIRSPPHALPLPPAGIKLIGAYVALIKMLLITVRKVGFGKLYKGVLRMKPQVMSDKLKDSPFNLPSIHF